MSDVESIASLDPADDHAEFEPFLHLARVSAIFAAHERGEMSARETWDEVRRAALEEVRLPRNVQPVLEAVRFRRAVVRLVTRALGLLLRAWMPAEEWSCVPGWSASQLTTCRTQLVNNLVRTLKLLLDEVKRVNRYDAPANPTQRLKEIEKPLRLVELLLERAGLPRRMIPVS